MMDNHTGAVATSNGVTIKQVSDIGECRTLDALLATVWRVTRPAAVVDHETIRALAFSGNYVAAAYRDGVMVGGTVSFLGPDGHLHSHVTGVVPKAQNSHVGLQLKLDQRQWALRHRIASIQWTFDPTRVRNAYFNIQKLGGLATRYLPDFYGEMTDGLNADSGPSDRLLVDWRIDSDRVHEALSTGLGRDGDSRVPITDTSQLRAELMPALQRGHVISGVDPAGWYLLEGQSNET